MQECDRTCNAIELPGDRDTATILQPTFPGMVG